MAMSGTSFLQIRGMDTMGTDESDNADTDAGDHRHGKEREHTDANL